MKRNHDASTIDSFSDEWARFDQSEISALEAGGIFEEHFALFLCDKLPMNVIDFEMGCGSGRWAKLLAQRVGHFHCIDPQSYLKVAKLALSTTTNMSFHRATVDDIQLPKSSHDFGYSLSVLYHVPDTSAAIQACVDMLKPGAPFLLYRHDAFANHCLAFKMLWRCADLVRLAVYRLPASLKHLVTDILAVMIYYPLARIFLLAESLYFAIFSIPLSFYRNHSSYTMRTDSRDRFGTPLQQRFTRREIAVMMETAVLKNVHFSHRAPNWSAVGVKK